MNDYEILYIIHPRLNAEEAGEVAERVGDLIRAQGGEVRTVDHWGRRRLAYPIDHQLEGTYVFSTFAMPPAGIAELESQLRIQREVLRSLVLKGILTEPGSAPPEDISRGRRPEAQRAPAAPADGPAADAPPTEAAPSAEEAPSAEAAPSAEDAAAAAAPTADAPAPAAATGDAPAEAAPAEAAPAEAVPAEAAPAEAAPAEAAPAEAAPAEAAPDAPASDPAAEESPPAVASVE